MRVFHFHPLLIINANVLRTNVFKSKKKYLVNFLQLVLKCGNQMSSYVQCKDSTEYMRCLHMGKSTSSALYLFSKCSHVPECELRKSTKYNDSILSLVSSNPPVITPACKQYTQRVSFYKECNTPHTTEVRNVVCTESHSTR